MDVKRKDFTTEDIRYTYKAPYIYASVLKWPEDGMVTLKSLGYNSKLFKGIINDISLLSYDHPVDSDRRDDGMVLKVKEKIETTYPVVFKIEIN